MSELKSAYDLANSRIIVSPNKKRQEEKKPEGWDFIKIPEFSEREDKVVEISNYTDSPDKVGTNETKFIDKDAEEKAEKISINTKEPETIHYDNLIKCHFVGSTKNYSGYSKMNRNFIFGLSNRNVMVKVEDASDSIEINSATQEQIEMMEKQDVPDTAPKIYSMTIPNGFTHAGKKIAYTMIESCSLHKDYREKLNLMDEIWVPSKFGEKVLKSTNIYPPVFVMPLGVDVDRYKPDCGKMNFGPLMRNFVFLCLSKYSYRKGFDILLKAYMEEFSGEEDVTLLLVTRPMELSAENKGIETIVNDFNSIKATVKKEENELPHISLYTNKIPEKNMPKVYNSANAFCLISRGEGFSICPMEAASVGLPVIASNVTSHTDFLNKDNSYLVEPDGYSEATINGKLSRMAKLCRFYEGQQFPNFGEDAIRQTREHMRFVYENYGEARKKAEKLRKLIINNFTWGMAIDKVYNRLRELQ